MRYSLGDLLGPRPGSRGRKLFAQTTATVALNGTTLVLNFAIALLLSRRLGPDGYGAYAYAVAWALLLAVPAMLGLSQLIVREVATYRVRRDWSRTRGLLLRANQAVLAASAVVCGTALTIFLVFDWPESAFFEPTLIALVLVPLLSLVAVRQSAIQGFGAVVLARVPEAIVAPTLMILLVIVFEATLAVGLSASSAVGIHVLAAAFAMLVGAYLLRRTRPEAIRDAEPVVETRTWLLGALPILVASGIQGVNVQAGTILTGSIAGSEEAGIYSIATRIAVLVYFLSLAAGPSLMPTIAELNERGEAEALQRLLTRAARVIFFASLPLVIGAIVFAKPLLEIFGAGFGDGVTALRILSVGQLVSLGTGFAGTILIMIGMAGHVTGAVAAGAVVNVALAAVLVPRFGAEGAAIGMATSTSAMSVLMAYLLWSRRGVYSAAFRLPGSRRSGAPPSGL